MRPLSTMDAENKRILLVDDNAAIHEDFKKILAPDPAGSSESSGSRAAFLGGGAEVDRPRGPSYELEMATQGDEAVRMCEDAISRGLPYAMAFVDVRMPPGPDGIQTIQGLWDVDERMQIVICTAYADYSFEDIVRELGASDRLLILKKPFDPVEVRQLAGALTVKWQTAQRVQSQMDELRAAEREARDHAQSLEVAMRALEEANEKSEAANRAKSEFLANMSHEIRTPMNAILGYADFLCDPAISFKDRSEYGRIIRSSGRHLLSILNDILDLSRIEAGRVKITSKAFSPVDLAREVVSLMTERAGAKGIDLQIEVRGDSPPIVESDPTRVRQILLNLVGNAIKFTEQGSVRVALSTNHDQGVDSIDFQVIDTGVGIPPEAVSQIFDAFSQADTSSTRKAGGTGLGLAISRRLADMLGGRLSVESELDRGSTFTLHLGLESPASAPADERPAQDAGERLFDDGKWRANVLLVEDVPLNQTLMRTILTKAGATVTVAENGARGVEAFQAASKAGEPFDLVLMDMQMPVMDGYEATRRLRKIGWAGPVIALTAHAMEGDRTKCEEAGCTDYATKPVERESLIALCQRLTAAETTPPALPGKPASTPVDAEARDEAAG